MRSILDFYNSSIGKKVLMSLTGLFLIIFLVEHLIGNLLLFANDNGATYENYSALLVSNPIIRTIEIVLFAAIFLHGILGSLLWIKNRRTRPVKYKLFRLKDNVPLSSRTTTNIVSGIIVALFLYIHLMTFFIPSRFSAEKVPMYELIVKAFSDGMYVLFYILALIVLGYHLKHGFQSAFQTLGLRSKKYTPLLDVLAFIVWFLIPLGFASIPIYFYFFHRVVTTVVFGGN